MSLLEHSLENYEDRLFELETADPLPSVEQVLDVLTARDVVHALLCDRTRDVIRRPAVLTYLDRRLRKQSDRITRVADLEDLRTSFHPKAEAWWWFFEAPVPVYWWDRFDRLWNALAIFLSLLSLFALYSISTRFLSGDRDTLGSVVVALQTALTGLVIGGVVTKDGHMTIDRVLTTLKVPIHFKQEGRLILVTLLLASLIGFRLSFPLIANAYTFNGAKDYEAGRLVEAQLNYQRAINLNPDNLEARFKLALALEDLGELEDASREYRIVSSSRKTNPNALNLEGLNNLARLYILAEDYDEAIPLLLQAKDQVKPEAEYLRYSILKNLGWARLGQERYDEAEVYLQEAIKVNNAMAPAHCLLAQVLEKLDQPQDAIAVWERCLSSAKVTDPDEDKWYGMARERLGEMVPQTVFQSEDAPTE
ncbi:tetratricopeptide repeat protein [Oculatella sp. FACHB-28]|uniref:tetratricopeptide repeat protein n=1 Tax=Cyanophyceae TaxID=3028117 RepID=UPI00168813A6|nr:MULTISPECIES: tetratricopeptide repeat protein [Cyanophyceae]MBD1865995.1 tetratricopeptide repeat protein [Cyanobacteria bacterium FACHB-471]MBD2055219.1 tetratricopeptide repeat protein [Oculatella sp. FACHB-28]MBD2067294.1 tetratricopeptide repeat protein [Leptolyngbya sp. FACHB-671]